MMKSLKIFSCCSKTITRCRILNLNLLSHSQTQTRSFSSTSVAVPTPPPPPISESTILQAIESSQRHFIEHLAPHMTPSILSSSLASFDLTTRCLAFCILHRLSYPQPSVHRLLHPLILTDTANPESIIGELARARERLNVDSTSVFDALIMAYCELEKPDEALECFYLMKEKGVLPKTETCNDLLMLLLKSNRTQAEEFMKHMDTLGIKPLIYTYEAKFQGKFEAVCVMFQRMEDEDGLCLGGYGNNYFIFGVYKEGRLEELASPAEMLELGLVPHAVTYDALIHECCWNEGKGYPDIEKAVAYKDEMISRGIQPSLVTYNLLIYAWFNYGDVYEAEDLIKEMQEKGMKPDVYTYNTMITGYFIRKYCNCWLYDEMVEKGIQPTVLTYNTMMLAYCMDYKMEEAQKLFDEMKRRGLKPDHISYNLLIAGYSDEEGDFDVKEAFRVRDEMLKMGVDPTINTYKALMSGCCYNNEFGHIEELLKEMISKCICTPDEWTYQYYTELVEKEKSKR